MSTTETEFNCLTEQLIANIDFPGLVLNGRVEKYHTIVDIFIKN